MKSQLALLLMTTTLGAGTAVLAAGQGAGWASQAAVSEPISEQSAENTVVLSDGREKARWYLWSARDEGDDDTGESDPRDDDSSDDESSDDGDDDSAPESVSGSSSGNGAGGPLRNRLFTNGTAPVIKSN